MNGIQGLMGGGQGPMPGQAPQQPMPGLMPQQGAPTPGAMVDQLATMPFEKLEQFYSNPRPQSPPLYAVIAAIVKQQKAAQMAQAQQGQQAMAQNAQMQQQPPIAEGVVQQARQTLGAPVMAMHGGEMHSYAGGGAVAFQSGGRTFGYAPDYELARKYGIDLSPYDAPEVRAEKIRRARAMADFEEQSKSFGDIPTEASVANQQAIQQAYASPSRARDVLRTGIAAAAPVRPPAPAPMQPARRPPTATPNADIASVNPYRGLTFDPTSEVGPEVATADPYAAASAAQQEAMRRAGEVPPEVIAARGGIDKRLEEQAATFAGETQRRKDLAQQRMQEALGRFERRGLGDMAGIGRLLEGMKGAKTLYGGLVGAGAAAGKYQEDKEAALRAAQEKFDLSGKEVFELSRLQDQVKMKQAELVEARASGDAQRSVKAAMDVAAAQKELANYQTELGMKREDLALKGRQVAAQEKTAEAAMTSAKARIAGAEGRGAITPVQLANLRDKARDNLKDTLPMIIREAKRKAQAANLPFDPQAAEDAAIEREMERLMPGLSGKKPAPAPAAGAANDPLGIRKKA